MAVPGSSVYDFVFLNNEKNHQIRLPVAVLLSITSSTDSSISANNVCLHVYILTAKIGHPTSELTVFVSFT